MKKITLPLAILSLLMLIIFLNKLIVEKKFDFPSFYCTIALSIGLMALQSYTKKATSTGGK